MLAFAVILFIALLVVLFVFDFGTDLKPGVMIKVKTLLTHFQVGCPCSSLQLGAAAYRYDACDVSQSCPEHTHSCHKGACTGHRTADGWCANISCLGQQRSENDRLAMGHSVTGSA